jgi:hypothetical protein
VAAWHNFNLEPVVIPFFSPAGVDNSFSPSLLFGEVGFQIDGNSCIPESLFLFVKLLLGDLVT